MDLESRLIDRRSSYSNGSNGYANDQLKVLSKTADSESVRAFPVLFAGARGLQHPKEIETWPQGSCTHQQQKEVVVAITIQATR